MGWISSRKTPVTNYQQTLCHIQKCKDLTYTMAEAGNLVLSVVFQKLVCASDSTGSIFYRVSEHSN
jgi:hypothetical protein